MRSRDAYCQDGSFVLRSRWDPTISQDGLDLGLIAGPKLDNGPSGKCREHGVSQPGFQVAICWNRS